MCSTLTVGAEDGKQSEKIGIISYKWRFSGFLSLFLIFKFIFIAQ